MPKGDRNFLFAVIGFLILSGIVWALLRPSAPLIPSGQYQKAPDTEYSPGSARCYPTRLARLPDMEASDERYRCEEGAEEHRLRNDDLVQQTRAADSAVAMVDLTYRQTLLGLAGAIFGVLTLIAAAFAAWYARDAATASRDALAHDREASLNDLRPWLQIGIEPQWTITSNRQLIVCCFVTLKNSGRTPAQNVCLYSVGRMITRVHTADHEVIGAIDHRDGQKMGAVLPNGEVSDQKLIYLDWGPPLGTDPAEGTVVHAVFEVQYDLQSGARRRTRRAFWIGGIDTSNADNMLPIRLGQDETIKLFARVGVGDIVE